jgi:hypothetical protein
MENKTHYRKAFNSPYLSSADIVEPTQLVISCVRLEKDRTKKTKDDFNTAYFTAKELRPGEILKPMILNATNSKMLTKLTGSPWIEDWQNVPVTVYVDPSVKFGRETVEGLRIVKGKALADKETRIEIKRLFDQLSDTMQPAQIAFFEQNPIDSMDADMAQKVLARLRKT